MPGGPLEGLMGATPQGMGGPAPGGGGPGGPEQVAGLIQEAMMLMDPSSDPQVMQYLQAALQALSGGGAGPQPPGGGGGGGGSMAVAG